MALSRRDQIRMTDDEVREFLQGTRTMTLATLGADGRPHLTAMWYGIQDGHVVFWSYRRAQKIVNLRRDPRLSLLLEEGEAYGELRGVSIMGTGTILDDPDDVAAVGRLLLARHSPAGEGTTEAAAATAPKRVAVRVDAERIISWDHRKLAGGY
ncbi:MAG: PPOX class F420-dependent oxidoreductase [Actinomycetota bacterium]|nr:PPOX class F420-dependent oxidoreductase [Actinomycetota bacterium]